jgi:hypothetical protein
VEEGEASAYLTWIGMWGWAHNEGRYGDAPVQFTLGPVSSGAKGWTNGTEVDWGRGLRRWSGARGCHARRNRRKGRTAALHAEDERRGKRGSATVWRVVLRRGERGSGTA